MTLGLFVPGLCKTEILDPICSEISRYSQLLGHRVLGEIAAQATNSGEDALKCCRQLIEQAIAGVFFAPLETLPDREVWNQSIADEFSAHGIPLILLDRDLGEFPSRSGFDLIEIANLVAALELTHHLLAGKRSRICFVARPQFPSTTDLRLLGCREAIRRYGIRRAEVSLHLGDPANQAFAQKMLLDAKPDAIICSNDQMIRLQPC